MKKGSRRCTKCGCFTHPDEGMWEYQVDREDVNRDKIEEALATGINLWKYKRKEVYCESCNDEEFYS